ncbi:hypothetical protein GLOIN_2v1871918 [Rhizophagus irregularis DAOM 181602=DAOM 197198]|uniref:Uncharacterized protein n=1 Tax=Rhizophagus irregularis (strain DAOM 181602 / DAOM 197198 / MUCL 43194) TaxID=747089 RepID=A0A2P4QGI0_RHIID|nr:hypothetical protein GLOIN_2v1871918 [Rhizophagus irregularis DAOM 181602=DAOM 197198]POG76752.1 hypothetical protein GLOIN_2v1871918 [Rhizophagus irregularis DAOM 181602=DAOM 197198]|eukprot:XP_025183618.1 hypothetical protein GLOIN_2v1871918 [Rhizophagus irregularis DAOM 181602=DAOM 197198]
MSIQNLLRTSRSNYGLQFASLYRLTSIRRYSTKVNVIQANNIQMNASVKDKPITNTSDTKSYSFANRRRAIRGLKNHYYYIYIMFFQNIHISKLPISVTHQDIEMLIQGIYPDNENPINKYIPKEIQMDPLNYRVGKCIILAGLPRDVTKSYLEEYLIQKSNKRFELADVTREAATISDTSKWLILSNSSEDIYFIFDRIHNNRYGFSEGSPSEKGFKIEAQTALDYIKGHEVFPHTKVIVYRAQYGMIIYNLLKVSGLIVDELAKTEGGKDIQSLFRRIMLTC